MPTWGWFIVALVLIDAAVLVAWLLARKKPGAPQQEQHLPAVRCSQAETGPATWDDLIPRLRSLKTEGNATSAIKLLRDRSGLSLRDAKNAVDQL